MAKQGGKKSIKIAGKGACEDEIADVKAMGATLIAWGEPDYPSLLHHIEDPPPLISVLGHTHLLAKKAVAVVGARNASINGKKFAAKFLKNLARVA